MEALKEIALYFLCCELLISGVEWLIKRSRHE